MGSCMHTLTSKWWHRFAGGCEYVRALLLIMKDSDEHSQLGVAAHTARLSHQPSGWLHHHQRSRTGAAVIKHQAAAVHIYAVFQYRIVSGADHIPDASQGCAAGTASRTDWLTPTVHHPGLVKHHLHGAGSCPTRSCLTNHRGTYSCMHRCSALQAYAS